MRSKGYRFEQFWLPDVTSPEFTAQARAVAIAIATSEDSADAQAFINSIIDEVWSDQER
jgi:hypothetical protein